MKNALKYLTTSAIFTALLPLIASARPIPIYPRPALGVPELDPSSAAAALSLLIGGALMLTGRRGKGR
jgi:hypothetical protein